MSNDVNHVVASQFWSRRTLAGQMRASAALFMEFHFPDVTQNGRRRDPSDPNVVAVPGLTKIERRNAHTAARNHGLIVITSPPMDTVYICREREPIDQLVVRCAQRIGDGGQGLEQQVRQTLEEQGRRLIDAPLHRAHCAVMQRQHAVSVVEENCGIDQGSNIFNPALMRRRLIGKYDLRVTGTRETGELNVRLPKVKTTGVLEALFELPGYAGVMILAPDREILARHRDKLERKERSALAAVEKNWRAWERWQGRMETHTEDSGEEDSDSEGIHDGRPRIFPSCRAVYFVHFRVRELGEGMILLGYGEERSGTIVFAADEGGGHKVEVDGSLPGLDAGLEFTGASDMSPAFNAFTYAGGEYSRWSDYSEAAYEFHRRDRWRRR